jgi:cell division protein FtsQ
MKWLGHTLTIFKSVLGTAFGPIWNQTRVLKVLSTLMLVVGLLVTCSWLLFWLGQRPVFTLNHLTIESLDGRELKHVNLPTIRSRAISQVQGNFFTIRLDQTRQTFESLPWVRKASVRRSWPNGIVVAIEEHQALAVWQGSDVPKLMNTYGELFVANMAEAEDGSSLLKVTGPEGSNQEVFTKLQKLNTWVAPWDTNVQKLELSSRYAWKVKLANGLSIDLGRELDDRDSKQIELSVERLMKSWPQVEEKWGKRIDSIDLRYANGYAIHIGKKL